MSVSKCPLALATVAAVVLATQPVSAGAEGCRFKGPVLFCLDGHPSLSQAVSRFGSAETAATIEKGTAGLDRIEDRGARERYRVSLERNNQRAIRYIKRADRQSRRGRIDAETFQKRLQVYRRALANYRLGMDRYHAAYWFDPVQDAPEGPNLKDDAIRARG